MPASSPATSSRAAATLRKSVADEQACAIGEIGLDYHYDFSPRAAQHEIFRAQVAIARELRLPVVIHTREATEDTFAILRDEGAGDVRGVFHCFTGDEVMARAALDLGFYLSFAGIVDVSAGRRRCATPRVSPRPTGCWPKPTRPTLLRCPTAASATSRRTSPGCTKSSRLSAALVSRNWRTQISRNFDALFSGLRSAVSSQPSALSISSVLKLRFRCLSAQHCILGCQRQRG